MSKVLITGNASPEEARNYVSYLENKYNKKVRAIDIELDGEYADLTYEFERQPFERIRRITGYLVGTMDHWNDAKRSEEADRVKHTFSTADLNDLSSLSIYAAENSPADNADMAN